MNWKASGRSFERQRIPQTTATRNLPGLHHSLNQYGVQTRFQSDDLSVTATAMSTTGSFHEQSHPNQRPLKLSSSDSKVISIMRLQQQTNKQERSLKRGHTLEEIGLRKLSEQSSLPRQLSLTEKRKISVNSLPPIVSSKKEHEINHQENSPLEEAMSNEDSLTIEDDESCCSSSDGEDLISDDDGSPGEDLPQSSLKFQDPSKSSFSSLAEVELPKISNELQPFVTTLIQERLLVDHECIMTGVSAAGMSIAVNNIVRAYEIKGPLDKNLLENALMNVIKIHPILSMTFHKYNEKLYAHIPKDTSSVHLENPLSYEKPPELITLARRKAFEISIINHESTAMMQPQQSTYVEFDDHLSVVSCGKDDSPILIAKTVNHNILNQKSSHLPKLPSLDNSFFPPLIRAKLISFTSSDHLLILSFSRVVCDYWSSCLFIQQLSHAYGLLEKKSSYRPSLAVVRTINKRQEAINNAELIRSKAGYKKNKLPGVRVRPTQYGGGVVQNGYHPICPPRAHFQQMAMRENHLLLIKTKERLRAFWESVITVTIRRTRGPPRIKVIPPIRIPNGFGEISRTIGFARPTTARLRPLTARNRPQTARRGSGFGMDSISLESLNGPKQGLLFIKIPEKVGCTFLQSLPVEYSSKIDRKELLSLMCLGVYSLLLGVCSKGWGMCDLSSSYRGHNNMDNDVNEDDTIPVPDPLLKYNKGDIRLSQVMGGGKSARRRSEPRRQIDVGSFLIGVDVSVRQIAPELTQGLFGPLSNLVGLRVDLSSNSTFADLILSLWSSLQSARCHSHFPFSLVAEELGLVKGLPVQFSYFYPHDVQQLSNPQGFHFMETTVGVTGKALARFGTSCYMNPLSTKMDDNTQLELMMWEGVRGNSVDGIFLYQTQSLRSDIVQNFSQEMSDLLSYVSQKPNTSLQELAAAIKPPYLSTSSRSRH